MGIANPRAKKEKVPLTPRTASCSSERSGHHCALQLCLGPRRGEDVTVTLIKPSPSWIPLPEDPTGTQSMGIFIRFKPSETLLPLVIPVLILVWHVNDMLVGSSLWSLLANRLFLLCALQDVMHRSTFWLLASLLLRNSMSSISSKSTISFVALL